MWSQSSIVSTPLPHCGRGRDPRRRRGRVRVFRLPIPSPAFGLRPQAPSPAVRERGYVRDSPSPLDQRAFVAAGALEGLLAGDRRDLLVIIPRALRLGGLLDLEQVHVADHPAAILYLAVLGHEIVDRGLLHLLDDGQAIIAAG